MEDFDIDGLSRTVARMATRRGLTRLLGGTVLAGLVSHLTWGMAEAVDDDHGSSHRRRRRRTRHKHRKNRVRRNKKHKKHKTRKPTRPANPTSRCTPRTCPATACGPMPDGCGGTLQCCSGSNQFCRDGQCHRCDVCQPAGACAFSSVQAAINATDPQLETIVVCPGTYVENADSFSAILIPRSLRLVGAGDGDDPDTNTILKPHHDNQRVVLVFENTPETPHVTLEQVRLTRATGTNGSGLQTLDAVVDLIDCTIIDNGDSNTAQPGGVFANSTQLTLTDTLVTGNTGQDAGGMLVENGSQVTFDTLSRVTSNHVTNVGGFGGILADDGNSVALPSEDNVSGNTSAGGRPNCGGGGDFTGDGDICTTR